MQDVVTRIAPKQDKVEVLAVGRGAALLVSSYPTEQQAWQVASHLASCQDCRFTFCYPQMHLLVVWHGEDFVGAIKLSDHTSLTFEQYLDYVKVQAHGS